MEEMENAEICMHQYNDIDFKEMKDTDNYLTVAEDLAFIIENTAIHETEEEHSKILDIKLESSSDSSSSSEDDDVQIIAVKEKVPQKIGPTICLYSSSEEEDEKITNCLGKAPLREPSLQDSRVIQELLSRLVVKVEKIIKRKCSIEQVSSDSESDNDIGADQERCDLAFILHDEGKVVDQIPKVRNETLPEELPEDIEAVVLTSEDNLLELGVISGLVETMIVIEANKSSPALDADTALFLDHDTFLGRIFDTFGPVKNPYYTVRLSKCVNDARLQRGAKVYFVPFNQSITKYVFVEELKKLKGSDASWKDDCEPPPQHIDYSDDEEERRMRKELSAKNKKNSSDKLGKESNDNNVNNAEGRRKPFKRKGVYRQHGNALLEHAYQSNSNQNCAASKGVKNYAAQPLKGVNQQPMGSWKYQHPHQIPLDVYYGAYVEKACHTPQAGSANQSATGVNTNVVQNPVPSPENRLIAQVVPQNTNVSQTSVGGNVAKPQVQNPYLRSFIELAPSHVVRPNNSVNSEPPNIPHHVVHNWQSHHQTQHVEQYSQLKNSCMNPGQFEPRTTGFPTLPNQEHLMQNQNQSFVYPSGVNQNAYPWQGYSNPPQPSGVNPVHRLNRPSFVRVVHGNMSGGNPQFVQNGQQVYNPQTLPQPKLDAPRFPVPYSTVFDSRASEISPRTRQPPPPFMMPPFLPNNQSHGGGMLPRMHTFPPNLPQNGHHFNTNLQPQSIRNTRPQDQHPVQQFNGHNAPFQRPSQFY